MRIFIASALVVLTCGVGCKKKEAKPATPPATVDAGAAAGGAGYGGAAAAGGPGTASATTTASGELKPVNECPPALKGSDQGLARTIPAGCSTTVEGEYYIDGTLTIEEGATLKFKGDAVMYVGYSADSKLLVKGTKEKPVTFTSAGDKAPGVWRGVVLYPKAARSEIAGLIVEYAGASEGGALEIQAADVSVKDSTVRAAKEAGLTVGNDVSVKELSGITLDKAGKKPMSLPPSALVGLGAVSGADAHIELRAGSTPTSGTWKNPGVPFDVTGEVYLEHSGDRVSLEIAAGNTFRFRESGALYVGYGADAELKVLGTAAAPVTFTSGGDKAPGAWERGVIVYPKGKASFEHAVFEYGGREERGALSIEGGKATLTSCAFKNDTVGVSVTDQSRLEPSDGNTFDGNKVAGAVLHAGSVGALGAGNTWSKGQKLLVHAGNVDSDATWALQAGATVEVDGEIYVDGGKLTLAEGSTYTFTDSGALWIGYSKDGTLVAKGSAGKPIRFVGARDGAGAWKGIELYSKARACELAHVEISGAGGEAGVRVSGGGAVTIDALECDKCGEAALKWDCASKVTQTGVKGAGGTAKGATPPEGC